MYCHGFGECFLVTLPRLGRPFHMLVNCGRLLDDKRSAAEVMRRVAEDILRTTAGQLDLVVVSNRHWDKVSGFVQARVIFDRIRIDEVWLPWAEDVNDPRVRAARTRFAAKRPDDALAYLRRAGRTRYLRGGDGPLSLAGVAGVRVFILGPPDRGAGVRTTQSVDGGPRPPFAEREHISFDVAKMESRFAAYFNTEEQWRRIDRQELDKRREVRLAPEHTNNLSLVMAVELFASSGSSKVLLFPGDAQLESWLSWQDHRWPLDGDEHDAKTTTARKLLERTVLYKVSHYGSHFGNPKALGLDLLTNPNLTALLQVDAKTAASRGWHIPHPSVLAMLDEKTHGHVIRSDTRGKSMFFDYVLEVPQLSPNERQKTIENWTAANERRVYLVDKKLAGTIKPAEEAELREIEKLMDEYLSVTAPTGFGLLADLRRVVEAQTGRAE